MQCYRLPWFAGLILAAAAGAQTPAAGPQVPQGPTIRTETKLVLVDAVVTDKKGNYVKDLNIKDFKVYEDEKQQTIKSFSFGADPMLPVDSRKHYMVLFFDNSSMEQGDQMRARQEAAKFIDANAGPDHLMAIVNFGGKLQISQNFTDDVARLKTIVAQPRMSATTTVASADARTMGGIYTSLGSMADFGARSVLMALRTLSKNLGAIPGRKSLVLFTSGFPLTMDNRPEVTAAIDACNQSNVAVYAIDVRGLTTMPFAAPSRGALGGAESPVRRAALAPALAGGLGVALAGSPVIEIALFFQRGAGGGGSTSGGGAPSGGGGAPGGGAGAGAGGGGSVGPRGGGGGMSSPGGGSGNLGGTGGGRGGFGGTGAGNTGYNPGGNRGGGGYNPGNTNTTYGRQPMTRDTPYGQRSVVIPQIPPSVADNQQVLYMLAQGTGGKVIANSNDLLGGLESIGHEQDAYYILGYTPPETEEGTCHTLKVKLGRGGLNVRARPSYCNLKSANLLAGKPIEKELETRASASAAGTVAARMQAPFFYTAPDTARVNLAIEIPSADIKFDKVKGKQHAEVNVLGIVSRPNADVAAKFSDTVKLDFEDKKQLDGFKEKPYHYENQFDVASGDYTLKVVFSSGGESFGKMEMPLKVDPYDGKQFSMSALALSSDYRKLADVQARLDLDLLEGRVPLRAGAMQFIPAGAYRFKTSENVAIYCELYDPLLVEENPPNIGVVMRVLDGAGANKFDSGGVQVANFVRKGNPVVPIALKLPVNTLAAGVYKLEVRAMDSAGRSFARTTQFEVQ